MHTGFSPDTTSLFPYAPFIHPIAHTYYIPPTVYFGADATFLFLSIHSQIYLLEMDNSLLFPGTNTKRHKQINKKKPNSVEGRTELNTLLPHVHPPADQISIEEDVSLGLDFIVEVAVYRLPRLSTTWALTPFPGLVIHPILSPTRQLSSGPMFAGEIMQMIADKGREHSQPLAPPLPHR